MDIHVYNELRIEGATIGIVRKLRGEEALGTLFRYEIDVDLPLPLPDLATLMGAKATITMKDADGHDRFVHGLVAEADVIAHDTEHGGSGKFVIRPFVWRQFLGRDCLASQDVTVLDVVKDVLADYPYPIRFDIARTYPKYPYRVQYREDDWTYLARILEEEGIYYWFDHEADSEVVFADDSTGSPAIEGVPALMFVPRNQLVHAGTCVIEASFSSRAAPHVFAGRSFDMTKPDRTIEARVGSGPHEIYDAPGGGTPDPLILKDRIRVGLEGATAARSGIDGLSTSCRIYPGRWFELMLHPIPSLDGEWFITKVELEGDAKRHVNTKFHAIKKEVPFRPPRISKEAKQPGLQMGVVVGPDGQEVHPDQFGRIRVQAHWDRLGAKNDKSGTWCRIAQRGTPGSMLLPRMGWNVAFFNEEGGVDSPSTLCRIHDGDHKPEYSLPDNKTRVVYKTATTPGGGSHNEVYFEDKGGQEEMFINASKDMNKRVKNRKSEIVQANSTRSVGSNYVLHVDAHMGERVVGNQTFSVGGNENVVVHDKYSKEVSSNEVRTIGGSRKLKTAEMHTATVDGNRKLNVGAAQIDVCLGQIGTTCAHAITMVGGAVIRASAANVNEDTTKLSMQLIGGARVDIAKKDRPLNVANALIETVGGGMFLKSLGKYFDNADTTANWTVLSAMDTDAPEVWIEAEEQIILKCGGSTITITEKTISIEGGSLDLDGAEIDADTGTISHN